MELWQGLALIVGLDPDSIDHDAEQAVRTMDQTLRETLADESGSIGPFDIYLLICLFTVGEIAHGKLKVHAQAEDPLRHLVRLDSLIDWARRIGIRTIKGWPEPDSWLEVWERRDKPAEGSREAEQLQMMELAKVLWADFLKRGIWPRSSDIEAGLRAEFPHAKGNARLRAIIATRPLGLAKGRPPGQKR